MKMGSPQLWAFSIGLASLGLLRAGPEPFPSAQVPEWGHGRARRAVGITSLKDELNIDVSIPGLHAK